MVTEYLQVWRAKVAEESVERLLAEYRLLCEEVRVSCTYGMLLCLPRQQRAAYLLADVLGLTDAENADILECSREAFRQRVSRARRTIRYVIDNLCPVAKQLDDVVAIGDLYRFDRFKAPAELWDELQQRYHELLGD